MEVKDIKKALKKLNEKANKRVYITTKVGGSFIDKEILKQHQQVNLDILVFLFLLSNSYK